jgi:hypothetical protein
VERCPTGESSGLGHQGLSYRTSCLEQLKRPKSDNLTVYFTVSRVFLNIFTLLSFIIYLFSTAKQHGLIHNATGRLETKR